MLGAAIALYKNIPVDFVDEAGLVETGTLKPYKVIFITEPDLPTAGANALGEWVKSGGTLITVSNAGTHDAYHEPSSVLSNLSGMASTRDAPAEGGLYKGERFYWPSGFTPFIVKNGTLDSSLCPNATLCKFAARGAAGDFIADSDHSRPQLSRAGPVMCNPTAKPPQLCPGPPGQPGPPCPHCGKTACPCPSGPAPAPVPPAPTPTPRFTCEGGKCTEGKNGPYSSRGSCETACKLPPAPPPKPPPPPPPPTPPPTPPTPPPPSPPGPPAPPPPPGGVLAAYTDGKPAIKTTRSGHGSYIHFAWLPGISFSSGGGAFQPSQENAIASLLQNLLHRSGVQEPVTVSIDNVEAPLLTSPEGDVVTVLNHANQGNITWDETGKIHGNLPLELSVTLGYTPASVLSTQLGELQHTVLAPGKVSVKLPTFHWADMVVFKRS